MCICFYLLCRKRLDIKKDPPSLGYRQCAKVQAVEGYVRWVPLDAALMHGSLDPSRLLRFLKGWGGGACATLRGSPFLTLFHFYYLGRVVKKIPDGSAVVFMFGEIDCREGLLVAVEKLRYDTILQGAERTIGIFIKVRPGHTRYWRCCGARRKMRCIGAHFPQCSRLARVLI